MCNGIFAASFGVSSRISFRVGNSILIGAKGGKLLRLRVLPSRQHHWRICVSHAVTYMSGVILMSLPQSKCPGLIALSLSPLPFFSLYPARFIFFCAILFFARHIWNETVDITIQTFT